MDIEKFWQATLAQDECAMRPCFHPDARIKWHCTNECFTADEFVRANCVYPGDWAGEIERLEHFGDRAVTVVHVFPKDRSASFHAVSFFRFLGDKIIELDEYWADDAPPPDWRREMNIGRPIAQKESVFK